MSIDTIDVRFDDKLTAKLMVPKKGEWIGDQIRATGQFYETKYLRQLVKDKCFGPSSVVIDVGASIGNHTVFFAQRCAKVIAFEPFIESYALLLENLKINNLKNVVTYNAAAACKSGMVELKKVLNQNVGGRFWGYSDESYNESYVKDPMFLTPKKRFGARCCRIDDVVDFPVHFMKIDAEGMEFDVLDGAENLIKKNWPIMLVEVWRGRNEPELAKFLKATKYKVRWHIGDLYLLRR